MEFLKNLFKMKYVVLFEKYKNTKNKLIMFCILQLYLIENNLRTIAQIDFKQSTKYHRTRMYTFLNENGIPFVNANYGVIISNDQRRLDEIKNLIKDDNYDHVGLSKKLGSFYKCSSNTYKNNHYRIVIQANMNFDYEIFAQMCKKDTLDKNLKFIYKIYNEVSILFGKLDKNIRVEMETYKVRIS